MNNLKVIAKLIAIDGKYGYQIIIKSKDASVEDYLQAINTFIDQNKYFRTRNDVENCEGCKFCCNERIPITNIDIIKMKDHSIITYEGLKDIIKNWCHVYLDGPVVDITLARKKNKNCIFLDEESYRCKIYTNRSLVCQTFICCPVDEPSGSLRDAIVNMGEDQLVRDWLLSHRNGEMMHIDDANEPEISLEDWHNNCFANKTNYNDVLIRDIIDNELWNKLYDAK